MNYIEYVWDFNTDTVKHDTKLYAKWHKYSIYSIQDLWNMREDLSGDYTLTRDLDFNDDGSYDETIPKGFSSVEDFKTAMTSGDGWIPICGFEGTFEGTFDGNNYKISNLYIGAGTAYGGLIGRINNQESDYVIKDIELDNANIHTTASFSECGILCGEIRGSLSNCKVTGSVEIAGAGACGGIVGRQHEGNINSCDSEVDIYIHNDAYVGGIIGIKNLSGVISNCHSKNFTEDVGVKTGTARVGGLAGILENNSVVNCSTYIDVKGTYAGGLIGQSYSVIIENCTVDYKSVEGSYTLGGLVGYCSGGSIDNCHVTNIDIKDSLSNYIGGFIGISLMSGGRTDIINSHTEGHIVYDYSSWVGGFIGYSLAKIDNCYSTCSITDVDIESSVSDIGGFIGLNYSPEIKNSYYIGDIRIHGYAWAVGGFNGNNNNSGGFIENCYSKSDIEVNDSSGVGGFEGYSRGGGIYNSYHEGNLISNSTSIRQWFGGFCGYYNSGSDIEGCYSKGNITAVNYNMVGGLVGACYNNIIKDCYHEGNVQGNNEVGGLVGKQPSANVENCYAKGNIHGNNIVGGLIGFNIPRNKECYFIGSVTGNDKVGGLVGDAPVGTPEGSEKCYSKSSVIGNSNVGGIYGWGGETPLIGCYHIGSVEGEENVGGLRGFCDMTASYALKDIKCFSESNLKGLINVGGFAGYAPAILRLEYFFHLGSIEGEENIGGIIGYFGDSVYLKNCYSVGNLIGINNVGGISNSSGNNNIINIENCYFAGEITGNNSSGLLKVTGDPTVSDINNFWDIELSGVSESDVGEGKTTREMKTKETFMGWDFGEEWNIVEGDYYE